MYHTCLRIVVYDTDAEDILQEAFMEAFTRLDKLKNIEAFGGWLKGIVINKSLNFIKRSRQSWVELEETGLYNTAVEEQIDEHAFQQKIELITEALGLLPDKYRIVINLHVFEGMSFEEIAAMMETPSATIRSQYLRGRQKILSSIGHKI